jgi:phage shock protein A
MSLKNLLKKGMDVLLAPAEDPREKYPNVEYHHQKLLKQVNRAIVQVMTFQRSMVQRKETLEGKISDLYERAQQAVETDQEELARLILTRRAGIRKEADALAEQITVNHTELNQLQAARQKIEAHIEKLRNRQNMLKAQYTVAEAQVELRESLSGLSDSLIDTGLSLEDAEQRTAEMQARAQVFDEMLALGILDVADGFEMDFVIQEPGAEPDEAIEDLLSEIKQKVRGE